MSQKENRTDTVRGSLPLIGGVVAAIGAGLCCIGPLILLTLGISGAWIANLTLLEPYRPIFIIVVLLFFGWAGWNIYRPMAACEPGSACTTVEAQKRRRIIFWMAAMMALLLISSNYWVLVLV